MAQDLESWKHKYYDSLEQLEAKEKQWDTIEQLLRQFISRLSLAADPDETSLNQQLEKLRTALRQGTDSIALKGTFDSLSATILNLDKQRQTRQTSAQLLQQLIDSIDFPKGLGRKAKAVHKRLDGLGEDSVSGVTAVAELIAETLAWFARESDGANSVQEKSGGLLGRLLGSKEKENAAATAPVQEVTDIAGELPAGDGLTIARQMLSQLLLGLSDRLADASQLERQVADASEQRLFALSRQLLQGLSSAKPVAQGAALPDESPLPVHEALVQLLERLELPSEFGDAVDALRSELANGLPPGKEEKTIASVADLVSAMRSQIQSEKAEIEAFLKQLTKRLQELDSTFQLNITSQRDSLRDGRSLNQSVQQQMAGIEDSLQQATDVEQLKGLVQSRVDNIRDHLESFRLTEDARAEAAEQQIAQLTEKLTMMENEADDLRNRVEEGRRQALTDPLTGIANRLAYNERALLEYQRWKRYGSPLSIAVWDVDRFKSVNDTYGHLAGDKVLTVVAHILSREVRETDFVARYGGEEFVLLMPETPADKALLVANKLREKIAQAEFHYRGTRVPITISCGISAFSEGDEPGPVFARADKALYAAKQGGRNRCCIAEAP